MYDYSEGEIQLIKHFGYMDIAPHLDPVNLYRLMVNRAFLKDMQGPMVEALRRAANALEACKIYRMTPEWEKLLEGIDQ